MAEFDRLDGCIEGYLSFVERKRTPKRAIQAGIRCHLARMPTRDASQFLDELRFNCSHILIHNWVRKANLQPILAVSADRLTVDGKSDLHQRTTLIVRRRRFGSERTPAGETVLDDDKTDDAMGFLAEFC
jgi:hypothetical protein